MNTVNQTNIPQRLKHTASFCCWQYETVKGRQTKVPYDPVTGHKARTNQPTTFTTFDGAIAAMANYDGIGIRVANGIAGIDLDHCLKKGTLLPWAREIVGKFHDTYIEISPSGAGIRIFCLVPEQFSYDTDVYYIKKGDIEVYIPGFTNRFLTVTGNALNQEDVTETTEALTWLLNTYMHRPTSSAATSVSGRSYLKDESVIAKASNAQNGAKFTQLWNGNISEYPSHSEADAALCSLLAFWCGGDKEQMDRLFRQSGLMRDKWDEYRGADTYGNMTILKAISNATVFYKPIHAATAAEDFGMDRLKELDPMDTARFPWTDIGAGRIFAAYYKDILRFVPERKMWFYYENGIWQPDKSNIRAMKYCMDLADLMYTFALEIQDEDKRKAYMKYVSRWQSHNNRVNILKDAQVHYPIPFGNFDTDLYIFNCKNGTLHIDTGEFTEHRSTDLLTKMSQVIYDPTAQSDRFDTYIDEIMCGDQERAKFLQKIMGYGLTGDTRHECMTILYGATTRNGKGTLCESVLKVLGDYGCTARIESIAVKTFVNGSQPNEDIARLAGIRFVNISEPGKGIVMDAAKVKIMTGNDTLNARYLHENSFDFQPQFKLYVNTNYLPVINDMTLFTSNRIIIVPFDRHFDEQSQDTTLKRKFTTPQVQSAILNWLLEGNRLLREEGLYLPESVKKATSQLPARQRQDGTVCGGKPHPG